MSKEVSKPEVKEKKPKTFFVIKEGLPTGADWAGRAGFFVREDQLTEING